MRRVTYKSVRDLAAVLCGLDSTLLDAPDRATLDAGINHYARKFWEEFWWPEWTPSEKRQFRDDWNSASTYGAPSATAAVEVYFARSDKYYQSLRGANSNNAPATGASLTENSAWWAESASAYSGDDWATGQVLAVGDRRRNPSDNRFYQCHTAHTAGASFDGSKFGILTAFVRDIDYEQSLNGTALTKIGEVRQVWDLDPYVYPEAARCRIGSVLMDVGLIVRGSQTVVYVEFRKRRPNWTGNTYAAGTTYAADEQVWDPTSGDYYRSIAGGNLGNAVTDVTKWERLDFPYVLQEAVAQGAFAWWLKSDGQLDDFAANHAEAVALKDVEIVKVERQQQQSRQLNVVVR